MKQRREKSGQERKDEAEDTERRSELHRGGVSTACVPQCSTVLTECGGWSWNHFEAVDKRFTLGGKQMAEKEGAGKLLLGAGLSQSCCWENKHLLIWWRAFSWVLPSFNR